jgi:UDP-N-acetyl-D-glucosamine dehydrogenase
MPRYVIAGVVHVLNEQQKPLRGSRVCLLGVAYKKDVDDLRESPSFELMKLLAAGGAIISYNDPHIPQLPQMRHHDVPDLESQPLTAEYLAEQDCVLIATDHSAYDYDFIVQHAPLVVDTRNACAGVQVGREKIYKC